MKAKKNLWSLALIISFFAIAVPRSFAEDAQTTEYQWHDKLGRGTVNAVTSPIEIIRGIDLTSKSDGPIKGWTVGLVKGLAGTVLRLGSGIVDFVTCPFNFPDKNKAPLIQPTYVWQDWEGDYLK